MASPFTITRPLPAPDKDTKRHIEATLDALPRYCHKSLMEVYHFILGAESLRSANLFMLDITDTLNHLPDDYIKLILSCYLALYQAGSIDGANLFLSQVEQHHATIARIPDASLAVFLEKLAFLVSSNKIDLVSRITGLWTLNLEVDDINPQALSIADKCALLLDENDLKSGLAYANGLGVVLVDGNKEAQALRLSSASWWARKIMRLRTQGREALAQILGLVKKHVSQYSYNYQQQKHVDGLLVLANNNAVSPDGVAVNMLDIAKTAIRGRFSRLLNWSDGMGDYAEKHGHQCAMYTLTCPSAMHPNSKKYDGTTTREAQRYLADLWNQANARFKKASIYPYGVRVSEPHKDGAVHWHVLLFAPLDILNEIDGILKDHALRVDGNETGADKHRYKFEIIDKSKGAKPSSYLFKYLMKGLGGQDDYTVEDIEKIITEKLSTVKAWARTHGIRQVQMVGGVSVGVWDELRNIKTELNDKHLEKMRLACVEGDYCAYFELQGGHTIGKRKHYAKASREAVIITTERLDTSTGEVTADQKEAVNNYGETIIQVVGIEIEGATISNPKPKWSISWSSEKETDASMETVTDFTISPDALFHLAYEATPSSKDLIAYEADKGWLSRSEKATLDNLS